MNPIAPSVLIKYAEDTGHSCRVLHSGSRLIHRPCSLSSAKKDGFSFYGKKRWMTVEVDLSVISLIYIGDELEADLLAPLVRQANDHDATIVLTPKPRLAFLQTVAAYFAVRPKAGVHTSATIPTSCEIASDVTIGAGVRLGEDVEIGCRTIIAENCVIGSKTKIGNDCFFAPGVAVGQPGFGYERDESGEMVHFPHIGSVIIGNNVEIGANTCIDRGTLDDTVVCDGVKIDNLCHISHNVHLEPHCVVIANSMVAGSVRIGERAWIAPSCSILNGVSVGADATVGMGGVVTKPVPDNYTVIGSPAIPIEEFIENKKRIKSLLETVHQDQGKK